MRSHTPGDCLAEMMFRENTDQKHVINKDGRCHFCGLDFPTAQERTAVDD